MQADEPTIIGEPPIEKHPAGSDPAMRTPTSDWQRVLQTTIQNYMTRDAAETKKRLLGGVTVVKDAAPEDDTVIVDIKAGPPYIEKDSHPGFQYTSADAAVDRERLLGLNPRGQRCDWQRCDCGAIIRSDRPHNSMIVERVGKDGTLRRIELSARDTCQTCLFNLAEPLAKSCWDTFPRHKQMRSAQEADLKDKVIRGANAQMVVMDELPPVGLIEPPVYGGPPKSTTLTPEKLADLVQGTIDSLCFADGPRNLTGIGGLLEADGRESAPVDPVASFFGEFKRS